MTALMVSCCAMPAIAASCARARGVRRSELHVLQRSVAGEIACVRAVTRTVLRTAEHPDIGTIETTIAYFFHDGTLHSDAISAPIAPETHCGYSAIPLDEAIES
jgi:hypothetical protein